MNNPVVWFICSVLLAFAPGFSHNPPLSKTSELIPIPEYSPRYDPANAENACKAALDLLGTFDQATRPKIVLALDAPIRHKWSNLPAAFVVRGGMKVGEMSSVQAAELFRFLATSLSPEGYRKVGDILAAETFLSKDPRASRLMWAPENYWFAFYGEPHEKKAWSWQFGGHHLAVNLSFENGKIISLSPTFLGTEPALFSLDGVSYEVIVDLHKMGEAVYKALDETQRKKADYPDIPDDVLTGANKDGVIPEPMGIMASEMNQEQRDLLLQMIGAWVSVQPDEHAALRMKNIEKALMDTRFAWKGTTEINTPSYFRIQGPDLVIELLSTGGNVGQSASGMGHYHTIYRIPSMDYGRK